MRSRRRAGAGAATSADRAAGGTCGRARGRRRGDVQLEHAVDAEPARDTLVGERGVEEAVADDVAPRLERRADDSLDQLGPGGREQRRLRPGRGLVAVEQQIANPLAERRASGLARRDDLASSARRCSTSSAAWVDLPEPSTPSNVTNIGAILRPRLARRDPLGDGLEEVVRRRGGEAEPDTPPGSAGRCPFAGHASGRPACSR